MSGVVKGIAGKGGIDVERESYVCGMQWRKDELEDGGRGLSEVYRDGEEGRE